MRNRNLGQIKAIICKPSHNAVKAGIDNSQEGLRKLVEGEVKIINFEPGTVIVCNKQAQTSGGEPCRAFEKDGRIRKVICGTFALCGLNKKTGELISLTRSQLERFYPLLKQAELIKKVNGRILRTAYDAGGKDAAQSLKV